MKKHALVLSAVLAVGTPSVVLLASTASASTSTVIYDDAFRNGFTLNQWNGTNDPDATGVVKVGLQSLSTTPMPWTGFFIHVPDDAQFASNTDLQFWVNGGSAGLGDFVVSAKTDTATDVGAAQHLDPVPANTWVQQTISLADLTGGTATYDTTKDRMLWFASTDVATRPLVYFDQIELVTSSTPPVTTVPPVTTAPPVTTVPPSTTLPPVTMPPTPGGKAWVIGNYPWYESYEVAPADFPYDKITHLQIGNLYPATPTTCCVSPYPSFDFEKFAADVIPRAHAKGKPVILQMGGAGGNPGNVWNAATATDAGVATLAQQIVAYATSHGFDGVDMDWEESVDWPRVTALIREMRRLWPTGIFVADIGWGDSDVSWAKGLSDVVDRMSSMTYATIGNWGGWDGPWHQGALYEKADHTTNGSTHPYSIDRVVRKFLAAGVPASKLGIGIGFYGSGYGDANGDGKCPSAPTSGWEGEWGGWVVDHDLQLQTIDTFYKGAMTEHWDDVAQTPWLSAAAPGAGGEADGWVPKLCYITYENERSATAKGQYMTANGLGSIIIWATPQDRRTNGTYPVLDALNRGLG
jgi:Glycosyl hydrolases family 18